MESKDSLFKLRWDNQGSLLGSVASLFREEAFIDTTIFTDGKIFKAHRLLLSASSPYLRHVLQSVPGEHHSVLLLPHIKSTDFEHVLRFIYEGEIKINQKDLKSFLYVARTLKIKGMDFDDEEADELLPDEFTYRNDNSKCSTTVRQSPAAVEDENESFQPNDTNSISNSKEHSKKDLPLHDDQQLRARIEQSRSKIIQGEYYDEKDITFLSGGEDDDVLQHHNEHSPIGDDEEIDGDSLPLLPEVSMEEDGSFEYRQSLTQDMQISSRSTPGHWGIPHSSTSTLNYGSGLKNISSGSGGNDGILMRMMKEPLKSNLQVASSTPQIHYDLDETGRRTKRYVQCTSCSKVLSSLSALKRHMEDVHCARIQGKCLICGRVYSSRNSLLTHVYSAHKKHHDYKAVARIIRESDFESFAASAT